MKISYKRDPSSSYIVIEDPAVTGEDSFSLRMLRHASISRLLTLKTESINGTCRFLYDISGKQAFEKVFENRKLSYTDLASLLNSIHTLCDDLTDHLLDINMVLLLPELIFLDHNSQGCYFCYLPGAASDFMVRLKDLFNLLLSYIDYDDRQAVSLAFSLGRLSQNENYTLSEVFSSLHQLENENADEHLPETGNIKPPEIVTNVLPLENEPGYGENVSFMEKARIYFKGKTFSQVYDSINSGKIIKEIKAVSRPSGSLKGPSQPSERAATDYPEKPNLSIPAASFMEESEYSEENDPLSDTSSLHMPDLKIRHLSGIENAMGIDIYPDHYPYTIGKQGSLSDYQLNWPTISRIHCRIYEIPGGGIEIEDLNSRNGTYINNTVLNPYERKAILPGDTLALSDLKFILR